MLDGFSWIKEPGVLKVIDFIYNILKIIRIVVPIGLIVMLTLDITKKVINPSEKEGQKKIMYRILAAVIVFFVPILVKFVFNIMGVNIDNLSIDTNDNNNSINTNSNVNDNNSSDSESNNLKDFSITNCAMDIKYQLGAKFTLNTNIPASYKGMITWSIESDGKALNIIGNKNSTSATFEVATNPTQIYDIVKVEAGGKTRTCYVNIERPTLKSVNITNCPSKSNYYKPGDKIVLNTDIPSSFKGEIEWKLDNNNNFIMTLSSDKRTATLEVVDNPLSSFSTATVIAGGQASSCLVFVSK